MIPTTLTLIAIGVCLIGVAIVSYMEIKQDRDHMNYFYPQYRKK